MRPELLTALLRFWAGSVAAVVAGYAVFRGGVLRLDRPEFQCLTIGLFAAGLVALMRSPKPGRAVVLATAFALFKLGLIRTEGWLPALSGIVQAAGLLLSAWIFSMLARRGVTFGKFLVLGPLVGGVLFTVTPLTHAHTLTATGSTRMLLYQLLVGLVIGNGVGFGVEVAELVGASLARPPQPGGARSTGGPRDAAGGEQRAGEGDV